jgi:hypothetical protein
LSWRNTSRITLGVEPENYLKEGNRERHSWRNIAITLITEWF